jgi:hypothetical protein
MGCLLACFQWLSWTYRLNLLRTSCVIFSYPKLLSISVLTFIKWRLNTELLTNTHRNVFFLTKKADHRCFQWLSWKYRLNLLRHVVFIKENLFLIQKLFILRLLDTIGSHIAFFLNFYRNLPQYPCCSIRHRIIDEYAPKRCFFWLKKLTIVTGS